MTDKQMKSHSKFMSLILRHKPEEIGITLDENGWANVNDLISGMNRVGRIVSMDDIELIVRLDEKQRYIFNEEHTKIRANQGHSIPVDVELKESIPPTVLYHGTASRFLNSILSSGLKPQSRLYVHLSSDTDTALKVGQRHGGPVVLRIDAAGMVRDDFKFYLSENNVWLTKHVPVEYITITIEPK